MENLVIPTAQMITIIVSVLVPMLGAFGWVLHLIFEIKNDLNNTKSEIKSMDKNLSERISEVENKLSKRISEVEARMSKIEGQQEHLSGMMQTILAFLLGQKTGTHDK